MTQFDTLFTKTAPSKKIHSKIGLFMRRKREKYFFCCTTIIAHTKLKLLLHLVYWEKEFDSTSRMYRYADD